MKSQGPKVQESQRPKVQKSKGPKVGVLLLDFWTLRLLDAQTLGLLLACEGSLTRNTSFASLRLAFRILFLHKTTIRTIYELQY